MGKIGIIGHFGFGLDLANGQTIKTRIVTEEIKKANKELRTVDAHGGIKAVLPVIIGCLKCLSKCDSIIILLTENGLKVAVPVLAVFNNFFHKRLHYVVIGGWLSNFIEKKRALKNHLKSFNYVYVETNTMKKALENQGFSNIVLMPNCKKLRILSEDELVFSTEEPLSLCTFSRVMKEKGIETIAEIVRRINETVGRTAYKLDIFGPIDKSQELWFDKMRKEFPPYILYKGIVQFDESVNTLKNYFALVFPTQFYTEGIPGTIIDAYAAGVPVISAIWESFYDVVEEGKTGFGYDFNKTSELESLLKSLLENPTKANALKVNCIRKANEYSTDVVIKSLIERL